MTETDFERCAADLLARAAINAAATTTTTRAHPLAAAAVSDVRCRRVGRGRVAAGVAASGALLLLAFLLCVRLSAAFLPLAPNSVVPAPRLPLHGAQRGLGGRASNLCTRQHAGLRGSAPGLSSGGRGPAMCNPVPTAIDPALAAVLLNLGLSRAAQLLSAVPRAGRAAGLELRPALEGPAQRPVGLVSVPVGDEVAQVLRREGARGTATLLRDAATKSVRR